MDRVAGLQSPAEAGEASLQLLSEEIQQEGGVPRGCWAEEPPARQAQGDCMGWRRGEPGRAHRPPLGGWWPAGWEGLSRLSLPAIACLVLLPL